MTPAELNKSLTLLLQELLADTGFSKKRIRNLYRKADECEQFLSFYFTRVRGLPGNLYSLDISLSFSFPEVDKLTCVFLGEEYDAAWNTGAKPLYSIIPGQPLSRFTYCSDDSLRQFAETVSADFRAYALPFYETYNTLDKLEAYFGQNPKPGGQADGFRVVRSGRQGSGRYCCAAAVLCLQKKWEKLRIFLESTKGLLPEQRERILEYQAYKHIKYKKI